MEGAHSHVELHADQLSGQGHVVSSLGPDAGPSLAPFLRPTDVLARLRVRCQLKAGAAN